MSLIQGIITQDFILVGYNMTDSLPNPVFKPNRQIIIGCDGNFSDTAKLLEGYCSFNEKSGFHALEEEISFSYMDFISIIEERFAAMQNEHEDLNSDTKYNISTIICGHNGKEFEISIFTLGRESLAPNGVIKAKKVSTLPYQGITLGDPLHSKNLHTLVHTYYHTYKDMTLLKYKHLLQDVFEAGMVSDHSIQGYIAYEKIRKNDLK